MSDEEFKATPVFMQNLMTKEFDELDEEDKAFMMGRASMAFDNFPTGVVTNDDGTVTIDKYVQAKITYNALSHKQQVTLMGSLLAHLFVLVARTVEDPHPELDRMLALIAHVVSPEFLAEYGGLAHDPNDEIN
jgi:hypothetical protein